MFLDNYSIYKGFITNTYLFKYSALNIYFELTCFLEIIRVSSVEQILIRDKEQNTSSIRTDIRISQPNLIQKDYYLEYTGG